VNPSPGANFEPKVVEGFGKEWSRFDQQRMGAAEALDAFNRYFSIFPWTSLPSDAEGFDAGCGSGRWARFVAPKVGRLHCIDASQQALNVATANLADHTNCVFHLATLNSMPLADTSMDFGYSLGVLHHIPDTASAIEACVRKLKPGAPFLVYLYYAFDNRPAWFRWVWMASNMLRLLLSRLPFQVRSAVCDLIAIAVYWPLAKGAGWLEGRGWQVDRVPLSAYRRTSLYMMRTDALDRFGTRLEKRFTRQQVAAVMEAAGLSAIVFHQGAPYWVAVGRRRV
jgi:SAM-dependent methyltransferase